MRCFIGLVPQKNNSISREMVFEYRSIKPCNHYYSVHSCLLKRRHDSLGDGNRANIQHGLEFSHPG